MIPTSKDFERHPILLSIFTCASVAFAIASVAYASNSIRVLDFGFEIDWEKVLPVIIKFAAETLVAAYSVFRLLKPIEARLAVVEAKLDLMGSGKELYRILSEEE